VVYDITDSLSGYASYTSIFSPRPAGSVIASVKCRGLAPGFFYLEDE
jgi:hypothetical protein